MIDRIADPELRAEIRTWLPVEEIEDGALQQLYNAARHPEAGEAIAVMPDCHVGYGVTIGCVFPTRNAVLPNAVGVDIGCGMCAVPTGVTYDRDRMSQPFWRDWSGQLTREVPTGFAVHKQAQRLGPLDRALRATRLQPLLREKAAVQLGTLGGGNHFLEAQFDEADQIWMMVHSGSRHTGLRIANHYNELAKASSAARSLGAPPDLASLPLDDATGQDYVHDMDWATDFALESRRRMIGQMVETFARSLARIGEKDYEPSLDGMINIHHNFAQLEEHGGETVMVHRKGATSAYDGQLGIIPGSMGAPSYIVRGRGNETALKSCSHGAGRQMGRNAAKKAITEAAFAASLTGTFSKPSMRYVDEAPDAYKDIATVISRQTDLVEIMHTLTPIITLKGDSRAKDD